MRNSVRDVDVWNGRRGLEAPEGDTIEEEKEEAVFRLVSGLARRLPAATMDDFP
jgi:hypothetical protein